ncbi:MAG: hypothetical protein MUF18_11360, partial [Fimbriiglobus sp.]|nr:hypothetical protein [Fimbriiglobus sp.]
EKFPKFSNFPSAFAFTLGDVCALCGKATFQAGTAYTTRVPVFPFSNSRESTPPYCLLSFAITLC